MRTHFEKVTEKFKLTCKLADDFMKMFIDIEPNGAHHITRDEILHVTDEFIARDLLNLGVIDDIAKHASLNEAVLERRIHKGRDPEPGPDGKILFLVKKFTGHGHVQLDSRGYANYTDLHLFDNITKEQPVARLYPPKPGVDGIDVLQNIIKAPAGQPAPFNFDAASLELKPSPDRNDPYQLIISKVEGLLVEENGKLAVKEELVINGNLDFKFGSIDFIGKVKIAGDIHKGFSVKARKGIVVEGALEASNLICTGGNIEIKGPILGANHCKIICSGEVHCKRAQEADIEAHGNITAEKEVVDCNMRTGGSVVVQGRLLGGESYVVCGVEAKEFGNDALKNTIVHLCSEVETKVEFSKLLNDIASHDKAIQLVELHLGPYATNPARIEVLRDAHKEKMKKLHAKLLEIQKSRIALLAAKKKMLETAVSNTTLRVNVLGKFYPGVEIIASEHRFSVTDEIEGPKSIDYNLETGEFVVGDLQGLQCDPVKPAAKEGAEKDKEKEKDHDKNKEATASETHAAKKTEADGAVAAKSKEPKLETDKAKGSKHG